MKQEPLSNTKDPLLRKILNEVIDQFLKDNKDAITKEAIRRLRKVRDETQTT